MTSRPFPPYEGKFGDWRIAERIKPEQQHKERQEFFRRLDNLDRLKQDEMLKKEAIRNIKKYPRKYFLNWLANLGRTFFSYPYSNTPQTLNTYLTIFPNMFITVFLILFIVPTLRLRKIISAVILFLLMMVGIYLGGTSLLSAEIRILFPVLPIFCLWFTYIIAHFIQIDHKIISLNEPAESVLKRNVLELTASERIC